ncbi:unnamed protein product [Candidula unifasciata]|uniref:Phosphatidylinositol-glycan biosynthesis class X protein n=1 Tax=Candidula unifasciata TaxID=100452 RepID=A0A8S3ZJ85_9EUPU|nr:unnamed protein product [Candidula unifasciata]
MAALILYLLVMSSIQTLQMLNMAAVFASGDLLLARQLTGSGFHRNLETLLTLPESIILQHKSPECSLLLFETLPPGAYADPFQINSLKPFGGPQVLFDRIVNIEAAEFSSKPHELFIFLSLYKHVAAERSSEKTLEVSLPIHARYHKPSVDAKISHSFVTILPPGLYSNCTPSDAADTIMAPCDVNNSSMCLWTHLPYKSNFPVVQLSVPVGQQSDIPLVVVATLFITVTVCAVLVRFLWTSQQETHNKHL